MPAKKIIKYKIMTVGCPVNQSESEAFKHNLDERGLIEASNDCLADIYIINSCVVTQAAARKSRKKVKVARKENKNAIIALMGCYGEIAPEEIKELVPGIDIIIGTKNRRSLLDMIFEKEMKSKGNEYESFEELGIIKRTTRKRPVIKIQEGCNQACNFCIVTVARGKPKSRRPENIEKEVKSLVYSDHKELILAGTNIGLYGMDLGQDCSLDKLLEKIALINGDFRIRLSSLEPVAVTNDILYTMKDNPKICKHLYLPLQSGSDNVLMMMNRNYTANDFANIVFKAKEMMPDISIIADLIVGFPGESDKDHFESMEFIEKIGLDKLHVFPYSPRPKTLAARLKQQVRPDIKEKRTREMKELGKKQGLKFHQKHIGESMEVLVERCKKVKMDGGNFLCCEGFSENYALVYFELPPGICKEEVINKMTRVRAVSASYDSIRGEFSSFLYE